MLKGLSSSFDRFISRTFADISENITKKEEIDINQLTSELISEENRIKSFLIDEKAYISNNRSKKDLKHCRFCSQIGHLEPDCWKKHPELRSKHRESFKDQKKSKKGNEKSNKDRSSLLMTISRNNQNKNYFIIDIGVTEHWTPIKEC